MNPGMVLTKVRFLCRDLNMRVIVTRHFLHPETGQHCAIGEEVELSYIHFLHMEGLGAAKMPAIKTKEEKAIYGKERKNK